MPGKDSISEIAKHLLALLPADGTPVLNRVMRVMLARDMKRTIDQEELFGARDLLLKDQKVGRLRGQGGQVFLLPSEPEPAVAEEIEEAVAKPSKLWPEIKLMEPLRHFLEGQFRKGLDLPHEAACIVEDTSTRGLRLGRWARPDFILVSAMRFKLMPGAQLDVHSFELKTEDGATDLAVYEALAQTRFTHFGHLVWHLPRNSKAENRLAEIIKQCEEHGVGLIRMCVPGQPESYEILVDPERKATVPATVDGFLEARLSDAQRKTIVQALKGAGR